MTNDPSKVGTLEEGGIVVEGESVWVSAPDHAAGYLRKKVHALSRRR
jgi:GTP cyclohydrolase II